MHEFIVKEVENKKNIKEFHHCCFDIYRHFPTWVCPLYSMVENIFNPSYNALFDKGEAKRWILKNNEGKSIGRIAAFYSENKFTFEEKETGAIGFFECIENYDAAKQLFEVAENWLKEKGFTQYVGPINFGETDIFWGLLTDGFDRAASFGMNYNPQYYQEFFKTFGFEKQYDQFTNIIWVRDSLPDRFGKIAEWVCKKNEVKIESYHPSDLVRFVESFVSIYNDAWEDFGSFTKQTVQKVKQEFKKFSPLIKNYLIWFAFSKDRPASFLLAVVDGNELIYDFKGKMTLWNKIKFMYRKRFKNKRIRIVVMGTKKEFQDRGFESTLFWELKNATISRGYEIGELSWVGDFNDKMLKIHEKTKSRKAKVHTTYIKKIT